jgi:aminoglycoside phosphotransferase (APT) family kinase protein
MDLHIDTAFAQSLIAQQFPHYVDLPITAVPQQGWDNRSFRLGSNLTLRLPANPAYAAAVEKESRALAALAPHLPLALPEVVALGNPTEAYPMPWSIRRWITGETLDQSPAPDRTALAKSLATTLNALRAAPPLPEFTAGKHSFFRGCHPSVYGDEVITCLNTLGAKIDAPRCLQIWQDGMSSAWTAAPVWVHGDIAAGNLLLQDGQLTALIDFGTCGIGDPACDLTIAWTYFSPAERAIFRQTLGLDPATWARARAWALWKALVTLAGLSSPDQNGTQSRALTALLDETA